ncbi:MAG: hypothetical protein Ct9H300mP6_10850 [Gammaproteobacteria bacterium]|nr:MAG: hypothetical protein Ct9H300mP6_10850 [Gammaproteobacteria bacterium]
MNLLGTFTEAFFLLTKDLLQWFHDNYMSEKDHPNPYVAPMNYKTPELLPLLLLSQLGLTLLEMKVWLIINF